MVLLVFGTPGILVERQKGRSQTHFEAEVVQDVRMRRCWSFLVHVFGTLFYDFLKDVFLLFLVLLYVRCENEAVLVWIHFDVTSSDMCD